MTARLVRGAGTRTVAGKRTPRLVALSPRDARADADAHIFLRSDGRKRPSQRAALAMAEEAQSLVRASAGLVAKGDSPVAYRRAEAMLSSAANAWLKGAKSKALGPVNGGKSSLGAKYSDVRIPAHGQVRI